MKFIVLHGDDKTSIDRRLVTFLAEAKKRDYLIKRTEVVNIPNALSSASIFGQEAFLVVEGGSFKAKEIDAISDKLPNSTLVYISKTKLTVVQIKPFPPGTKFEEYSLPKLLYAFIDSFTPNNQERLLPLFHSLIATQSPEFVFALLARRIKDLYWVKTSPSNIAYPSWIVSKLEGQAKYFKTIQLKKLLRRLLIIDVKTKTSEDTLVPLLDDLLLLYLN